VVPREEATIMTDMSKPVEILYRALFDELKFAKQQQWTITNYLLVLMGAMVGLAKLALASPIGFVKFILCVLVVGIVLVGFTLLLLLQLHLYTTRERLKHIKQTFTEEDKKLVAYMPAGVEGAVIQRIDKWLRRRCKPAEYFFVVLCGVVIAAGITACVAICLL
jgi:hypothetical protein